MCISDFFATPSSGKMDVMGLSLVTIGPKASVETQRLFEGGEYTRYLYLHGLSVETAEALAEFHHKKMREELGIAAEDSPQIRDLFHQKYRGSRYSFGLSLIHISGIEDGARRQQHQFRTGRVSAAGSELGVSA